MVANLSTIFLLLTLSGPCLDRDILEEPESITIEVDGFTELNHIINQDGSFRMSQIIVWEWDYNLSTHVVRGWISDNTTYNKSKEDFARDLDNLIEYCNSNLKFKPPLQKWPQNWPIPISKTKWIGRDTNQIRVYKNYCDLILSGNSDTHYRTIYRTKFFRETKTIITEYDFIYDIEVINREVFPVELRKGIRQVYKFFEQSATSSSLIK